MDGLVLDFHEYRKIKDRLLEEGFHEIHMHDACGGQYFSIDDPDDATCEALEKCLAEIGAVVSYSKDRSDFTISKKPQESQD